jgi:hypothetical protein
MTKRASGAEPTVPSEETPLGEKSPDRELTIWCCRCNMRMFTHYFGSKPRWRFVRKRQRESKNGRAESPGAVLNKRQDDVVLLERLK